MIATQNKNRPDEWISSARAAEIIGCTAAHVTSLATHGKIEARKFDRRTKQYNRASVEEYAAFVKNDKKKGRPTLAQSGQKKTDS